MVLFQILKELSSKRLSSDQRNFREVVMLSVLVLFIVAEH